jgi:hypothetical protein
MTGKPRRRSSYGESLVGTWVLIIGVGAVMVLVGATAPAAAIIGAGAVIALAVAASKH